MEQQITWNKETIKKVLSDAAKNPEGFIGQVPYTRLVKKMLVKMYERQTADEQQIGTTKHYNNIGFNGRDAYFLSDVARRSMQYAGLTKGQTSSVAKSLIKYAGQLESIAKESRN